MPRKKKEPEDDSELPPLKAAPRGLAGKVAAEPEIIRWVARSIDTRSPSVASCPDPFAWTLLRKCRADEAFSTFFVEKLWSKLIPTRSQLDTTTSKELDGQLTIDLIDRIARIRDDAVASAAKAEADTRKGALLPTKSYFADFDPEKDL